MQFENVVAGYQGSAQREGSRLMDRKWIVLVLSIAALAASVGAQTNVTNSDSGTSGTVPVYNGAASLTNSPISVSGSSVGIGTTSPS
jgi:hypothetical protein